MKTKISRIPKELDDLAEIFKDDFKQETKVGAFKIIGDIGKNYFNLFRNKKGQILELFAISFAVVIIVIMWGISGWGIDKFSEQMNVTEQGTNANDKLQTFSGNIPSWIDMAIVSFFVLLIMGLIIINFFLNTSIFATVFYFLAFFFIGGVFKMFHNTLDTVKNSEGIGTFLSKLTVTNVIMSNYWGIMLGIFLFFMIVFFAKPGGRG